MSWYGWHCLPLTDRAVVVFETHRSGSSGRRRVPSHWDRPCSWDSQVVDTSSLFMLNWERWGRLCRVNRSLKLIWETSVDIYGMMHLFSRNFAEGPNVYPQYTRSPRFTHFCFFVFFLNINIFFTQSNKMLIEKDLVTSPKLVNSDFSSKVCTWRLSRRKVSSN